MRRILLTAFIFLIAITAFAQHRDESQMLFIPGQNKHAKAHAEHIKHGDAITTLPDSAKLQQSALADEDDVTDSPLLADSDTELQEGIEMLRRGEYTEALKFFGEASRHGNHEAQYRIGLMYRDGTGVSKKPEEAAYWFRKAASNGHAEAQYQIALCFAEGKGVLRDSRVAAEWMWRAAEQGHPQAAYKVGWLYYKGDIMQKNLRKAAKYMTIAANADIPGAKENLQEIETQLSKEKAKNKTTATKSSTKNKNKNKNKKASGKKSKRR